MRVADRGYFFCVGVACAVGWQYRVWPLPLLAFALLEGVGAYAGWRAPRLAPPVGLHVAPAPAAAATQVLDEAA